MGAKHVFIIIYRSMKLNHSKSFLEEKSKNFLESNADKNQGKGISWKYHRMVSMKWKMLYFLSRLGTRRQPYTGYKSASHYLLEQLKQHPNCRLGISMERHNLGSIIFQFDNYKKLSITLCQNSFRILPTQLSPQKNSMK